MLACPAAPCYTAIPVIDLPTAATFSAVIADPRFALALGISVLSGAVRGFSGFGSALIYVPLMSALYGPQTGAATFLLTDFVTGIVFSLGVWRLAVWREVIPIALAAILAAQFGTLILQYADPVALRWTMAALVLVIVVVLSSGWRYHGKPMLLVTIGVGLVAGVLGGAVQISGPPVVLFWLSSMASVAVVRANFVVFFAVMAAALVVTYLSAGLLTAEVLAIATIVAPLHILAMFAGAKLFHFASELTYRRVAYVIITLAALVSMPLWDRWLR
jgi:uncharacterized membrane protein YfcA